MSGLILAVIIGLGIWFGLGLFALSVWVVVGAAERIAYNRNQWKPWYRWLETR